MKAEDFTLPDQNNAMHTLKQYRGSWVVLYFYPKDDTPGCTIEACKFRDSFHELQTLGVIILGISKDSVASHKKFAEKYHLNFPILSDASKKTIQEYDACGVKKFLGKQFEGTLRKTYVINPDGDIKKVYNNVNPTIHAGEIIRDIKQYEL